MTAALAITTAVKAVPVKQIGYSGLMLPVMEDKRLAQRWAENTYEHRFGARVFRGVRNGPRHRAAAGRHERRASRADFGDVAALAWKWHKPLSARLLPVKGKKAGDKTDFDSQYLFNTTIRD